MNTAQDILEYTQSHDIQMSAKDGKLILEGELTDELLEKAREHKPELLLFTIVSDACEGLTITPQQFTALLTEEDKHLIIEGKFEGYTLRAYAKSFSEGIQTGRITFHPTFNHGIPSTKQYTDKAEA